MTTWPTDLAGVVALPDGRLVRGRALRRGDPSDGPVPDLGVYLATKPHDERRWETRWVRWPDFRLPADPAGAITALREVHERSAEERVEIACGGGRGRTGTAIALLARLSGMRAADAVAWARLHYRPDAVETP